MTQTNRFTGGGGGGGVVVVVVAFFLFDYSFKKFILLSFTCERTIITVIHVPQGFVRLFF